jgi:hypothetical protein
MTFYQSEQHNCLCTLGGSFAAPEAQGMYEFWPNRLSLGTWTYTATNRLLLQAGAAFLPNYIAARRQPGVTSDTIPITELSTGFLYNATAGGLVSTGFAVDEPQNMSQHNERFVVSYVTGSHAFKAGMTTAFGGQQWLTEVNNRGLYYRFNRGVPVQLQQWATPNASEQSNRNVGLFAQDQWTLRGFTLNLGVRFDHIKGWVPAQGRIGRPGSSRRRSTSIGSTTSRTSPMSLHVLASPTTSSAPAGPRSRRRWAATWGTWESISRRTTTRRTRWC